ncbi:MAG: NUDIX hydrolase [Actinomycetes bacterium]
MNRFSIAERKTVLKSFVFEVERRTVRTAEESFTREIVVHPGAVAVVAVNSSNEVALLRQYRATLDRENLEIPAGTCDVSAEDSLATAKRELLEEIGGSSDHWTLLTSFYNSPGWTDQATTVYLAEDVTIGAASPEGPEEIALTVHWMTVDEVRLTLSGSNTVDGTAAIGLYAWLTRQH